MIFDNICSKYINEIKALEEEISKLRKDHLTGVYTRVYLDTLIQEEYVPKLQMRECYFFNVYLFDLNNLHDINREQGYFEGDQYIIDSVNFIKEKFRNSSHRIFRLGGDEFVVISSPSDKIDVDDLKHPNFTVVYTKWSKNQSFREVIRFLDEKLSKMKKGRAKYTIYVNDDKLYKKIMKLIEKETKNNKDS